MLKLKLLIFWPPDVKNWLIRKDWDAGKDWGQEEKEVTEDEMVGWHHWLSGHEFKQTPRDSEGQGSLAFCSPRGHRVGHSWVAEKQNSFPVKSSSHQYPNTAVHARLMWLSFLSSSLNFPRTSSSGVHEAACWACSITLAPLVLAFLAPLTEPVRLWCAWSWGVLWKLKTWSLEARTHCSA